MAIEEFMITCGQCKHSSPAEEWIERPSGLRLPEDCFQCPVCAVAFKRVLQRQKLNKRQQEWWGCGSFIKLERIPAWL